MWRGICVARSFIFNGSGLTRGRETIFTPTEAVVPRGDAPMMSPIIHHPVFPRRVLIDLHVPYPAAARPTLLRILKEQDPIALRAH